MNKRMTPEQELDRLLDEDGGEFGAIYGRLSRPEPPRRLDRAVLANAARAVHGGRAPRAQRWALAMGSVAGVVLAAGIAWQVGQEMQTQESVPEGSRSMQDPRVVPVEAITEPRSRPQAKSDLIMHDADVPRGSKESADQQMARKDKQPEHVKPSAPVAAQAVLQPVPAQPPPSPAAPPTPELASHGAQESAGAPAGSLGPMERSATGARDEAEPFPENREEAVAIDSSLRAEHAKPAAKASDSDADGTAGTQELRSADAETRTGAAPAVSTGASMKKNMQLAPQAWLEEIERLADNGQHQQAVENLRLFRSQYPDWPLPDALRQLDQ